MWDRIGHSELRLGILELPKKFAGDKLVDCSQVVDKILLSHTDTDVGDVSDEVLFVGLDLDAQIVYSVQNGLIGDRAKTDFVESIRGINSRRNIYLLL